MTPDQERSAETLAIIKWKGDGAEACVVERLVALHDAGDRRGLERFGVTADRLRQIRQRNIQ